MPEKTSDFDLVRTLIIKLPDVVEGTLHGAPSWKVGGKLLACQAIHKSAEPNSLAVRIEPAECEQLIVAEPRTYYLTEHYRNHPIVLVRLAVIDRKSLAALLKDAWLFVTERGK